MTCKSPNILSPILTQLHLARAQQDHRPAIPAKFVLGAFVSPSLFSTMFNNNNHNSVSISVSDDDSDELGRMRVRVRSRKRKKPGYRFKNELARRVVRKLVRYWTLLIFLAAAGLLLLEASRIGSKSSSGFIQKPDVVHSNHGSTNSPSLDRKSEGNLNRLDPTTRVVGGVRERKLIYVCARARVFLLSFFFLVLCRVISCPFCLHCLLQFCECLIVNFGFSNDAKSNMKAVCSK